MYFGREHLQYILLRKFYVCPCDTKSHFQELILRHAKVLVEMENSGCRSMFRDDKVSGIHGSVMLSALSIRRRFHGVGRQAVTRTRQVIFFKFGLLVKGIAL